MNAVSVDPNTASVPLLSTVSGLSADLARNIGSFRDTRGCFNNGEALKELPRLGYKVFEQATGFLCISMAIINWINHSVHLDSYSLVEKMLKQLDRPVTEVIGNKKLLKKVAANKVLKSLWTTNLVL